MSGRRGTARQSVPPPPPRQRARLQQPQTNSVNYLCTTKFADVSFSIVSADGIATRIPAHRILLARGSDVFREKFDNEWDGMNEIMITDTSATDFKEFLQFFYGFDADLSTENVVGVMSLGAKYSNEACVNACAEYLKQNLTDQNVCAFLSLATRHNWHVSALICEKRIQSNTAAIFALPGFLECSKEVLAKILKINPLSCSEVDVFEACMSWVRAKSQQNTVSKAAVQTYLGHLYYEIRFASMSIEEFCALDVKYSDVLRDDFHAITHLIVQSKNGSRLLNPLQREMKHPRQMEWNENAIINCRTSVKGMAERQSGLNTEICFSTSKTLLLGSILIINNSKDSSFSSNLTIEMKITEALQLDGDSVNVLSSMIIKLKTCFTIVTLQQPVLVRPGCFYTISNEKCPENRFVCSQESEGLTTHKFRIGPKITTHARGIHIKFYNNKEIADESAIGVISELNFNEILN